MHMPRELARLLLICTGLSGPALAAGPATDKYPEIEYVSPDQSVWTTRVNARGEADNPLIRVAAELFAKAAIPWHHKSYPASRMFSYLQDGTAQFSMLVRAPALQDCCLFSKKPITTAEIRAYRRADTAPVKVKEDLIGKQVITIRGYSYGGLNNFLTDERQHVTSHVTQSHASAFKMLANGRADYVIDYAGPANEVLADDPIEGVAFDVLTRQDVLLVLSKSYPNAPLIMDRLEAIATTLNVSAMLRPVPSVDNKGAASR
jgi:ABC-type amino acid transport substrate-binding protein